MHPLTYLHFQLQLEGMVVVDERLRRDAQVVPEGGASASPAAQSMPLLMISRLTTQEVVAYYHESMEKGLQKKLAVCIERLEFPNIAPLLELLNSQGVQAEASHFVTYVFPPQAANFTDRMVLRYRKQDLRIQAFGFNTFNEYIYGIEQGGRVVSACVSTRENELCGEAWVQTAPEYQRQGLAGKVVKAWAKSLMLMGKIPFYSRKADNAASASLAKRLGLQFIFEQINISQLTA
jgi:hypothetical protein